MEWDAEITSVPKLEFISSKKIPSTLSQSYAVRYKEIARAARVKHPWSDNCYCYILLLKRNGWYRVLFGAVHLHSGLWHYDNYDAKAFRRKDLHKTICDREHLNQYELMMTFMEGFLDDHQLALAALRRL